MTVLQRILSALSSKLFGQLLSGERGARRFRLAGFAMVANVLSKALGFAVLIYSTRVVLEQLGTVRFGVWVTISSIATLLSFMDFGVSNALIGRVAALSSKAVPDRQLADIVSGGLAALLGIGVISTLVLGAVFAMSPLDVWFRGIPPAVVVEGRLTGYVFASAFGLSLAAQGIFKIYSGIQQGWIAHLTSATGWLASLLLIGVAPRFEAPMWFYLFATYGVQQIAGLLLSYGLTRRGILKTPQHLIADARALRGDVVLRHGQIFFIIQIAFAIGWGANQFILSSMIGPSEAAAFGVLQRLFMIVQVPLTILNLPFWAIYADAFAHDELLYIRSLLKRSMLTTISCAIAGVLVLIVGQRVFVGFLSGERLALAHSSIVLMALWTVIEACGMSYSMYLNGVNRIRPQAITGVVYTIGGLPLKIAAVHYFGLNGLITAIILSYVLFAVIPYLTLLRAECLDGIITG